MKGFSKYDPAEHINTPEDVALTLEAAFEDGDPGVIAAMIGAVARSKGMADIARSTGLSREALYRALSTEGNPTLSTTLAVLKTLGVRLKAVTLETVDVD